MAIVFKRSGSINAIPHHTVVNMNGGDVNHEDADNAAVEAVSTSRTTSTSAPRNAAKFVIKKFRRCKPGRRSLHKCGLGYSKKHRSPPPPLLRTGNNLYVSSDEEIYEHLDSLSKDSEDLHPEAATVDGVPILMGCCVAMIFMLTMLYVVHALTVGNNETQMGTL